MRKIPTVFRRDPATKLKRVMDVVNPGCEWVLAGEGVPTRQYDGTCCLVRDGKLYKRHEVKPGWNPAPADFEPIETDENTGKTVGWVPVGDGPENQWHWEAFRIFARMRVEPQDGTYELVGPKIQGNPEGFRDHHLINHATGTEILDDAPRDFEDLKAYMTYKLPPAEGIVWHHPDGRMAKLKIRDFVG